MKYAVMSDVHANPQALETALEDARRCGCNRFVMLGDTTGYGYDANRSIGLVRENFDVVLMGNHDSACVGLEPWLTVHVNRNYDVDRMQREMMSREDAEWLGALQYAHEEDGCAFVHGDFTNPRMWNYILTAEAAVANLDAFEGRVLFCGHTHHAAAWELTGNGVLRRRLACRLARPAAAFESSSFGLRKGCRYVVNVGSVGHPRNDYCCTYVIFDTEDGTLAFRRFPIDLVAYAEKLRDNGIGIPFWLAIACEAAGRTA